MRLRNLSYVTLWAVNFDLEKNLYKEILGLPVAQENDNFIMFDTKGSRLAFHRLKKGTRLDRRTVEVHFEVDNVDEVYSALQRSLPTGPGAIAWQAFTMLKATSSRLSAG